MRTSLIDSEFRTGFPADQILDSIEENAAYLTVIGSTGQSGFIKKWFGSVSTKVMNESASPVLVIPEHANYKGIHRIVYAYEDIAQDKEVIDKLVDIADRFGAEIHLIHIESKGDSNPGFYLTELINRRYPKALIKTVTIIGDDIAKEIANYSVAHKIDVISLSTHKKRFFEKLYDTSVSQKVTEISQLPILILKP